MIEYKIFDYFIGSWKIERILSNLGIAEGTATFIYRFNNRLDYSERLKTNYKDFTSIQYAVKDYKYFYEQNKISKNYENGSLLYNLDFSSCGNYASGTYLCREDLYKAYYLFIDSQNFTLDYIIKGPSKDFTIHSHFTRIIS